MKRLIILFATTLFSGMLISSTFILKKNAEVSSNLIKIKDVALMSSSLKQRIGELVISAAPEIGAVEEIKRQEIYQKLKGNGIETPILKGSASVRVTRNGTLIKPQYFRDRILNYIQTHSKWKKGINIKILSSRDIIVPQKGVRWQIMPANGEDFFGNILFQIKGFVKGEQVFSNWIMAKLRIESTVAVSNRTIQKDEIISENDLRWEKRELTRFLKDAVLEKNKLIGQKSGRIIRPNTVITSSLIKKKYLVKRGQTATLLANFKNIKATSSVVCMANGYFNDSIKVMNKNSRTIISATVVGINKVEVKVK